MKSMTAALPRKALPRALALALAGVASMPALAIEFSNGDFTGTLDTTITYGVSSRVETANADLIGKCNLDPTGCLPIPLSALPNAVQRAAPGRFSVNSDDGNLNYERGDIFSNALKITSEFGFQWGEKFGGLIRGTAFYDTETENSDFLSDLAKDKVGKDAQLLDAFVYYNFDVSEGTTGSVRLGRQVVSWGESTFIQQGINVINPIDVSKLRVAGAELKEAFLPVDMVQLSFSFSENLSVEGVYLFEFEQTEPEPRGTYFSTDDFGSLGSEFVMLSFGLVNEPDNFAACFNNAAIARLPNCQAAVPRLPDRFASDSGQFGGAVRYFSPELNNTEFGFYYLNYHSRLPVASGFAVTSSAANSARYFIEYPEDIKLFGASFNTTLEGSGIALQGEVSYRDDVPLQIDDVELLFAALSPLNVIIPQPGNRFQSQLGQYSVGQLTQGWARHEMSQLQVTATKVFGPGNFINADQISAVAEIGWTKVWDLPDPEVLRYNGPGTDTGGGPDATTGQLRNPQTEDPNAFATDFSWGYRLAARADYNNFLGSAFTVSPRVAFNHDVNGITPGPGGNFLEGRRSLTWGVEALYLSQWSVDASYTRFSGAGRYNLLRDRDFVSVSAKYSF